MASKAQGKYGECHSALMKERRVTKDNTFEIAQTAADFKGRGVAMIGDTFVHPKSTHGVLVQLTEKD